MFAGALWMARTLPADAIAKMSLPYRRAIASVFELTWRNRVFRLRSLLGGLMFASFGAVWGSMALPLANAPWHLSTLQIGLFGIVASDPATTTSLIGGYMVYYSIGTGAGAIAATAAYAHGGWSPASVVGVLFALAALIVWTGDRAVARLSVGAQNRTRH